VRQWPAGTNSVFVDTYVAPRDPKGREDGFAAVAAEFGEAASMSTTAGDRSVDGARRAAARAPGSTAMIRKPAERTPLASGRARLRPAASGDDGQVARILDWTFRLTLMLVRQLHSAGGRRPTNSWMDCEPPEAHAAKLAGATLGIVGFGRIGQAVAARARRDFGMRVVVHDRWPMAPRRLAELEVEAADTLAGLLAVSDVVSLHCSSGAGNRHLIDAVRLNQMKASAFLINTAHRELVDELALCHALWFETIAGAGIATGDPGHVLPGGLGACENLVVLD
jgi:hypothetical protein